MPAHPLGLQIDTVRKHVPRTSEKERRARHEKAVQDAVKLIPAINVPKKRKPISKSASVKGPRSKSRPASPSPKSDVTLPKASPIKKRLSLPKKSSQSLSIETVPVLPFQDVDISTKSKQLKAQSPSKPSVENTQLPSVPPILPSLVQQSLSVETLETNLKPLQEQYDRLSASIATLRQSNVTVLQSISEIQSEVAAYTESTSLKLNRIDSAIAGLSTSITGAIQSAVDTSIRNLEVSLKLYISQELHKLHHETMTRQWTAYPFPIQAPLTSPNVSQSLVDGTQASRTPTKRSQPETPHRVSLQKRRKSRGKIVQSESEDDQDQEVEEEEDEKTTGKQNNIQKLIRLLSKLD